MKYKALLLDFDDTLVDSTKVIHYPIYVNCLKLMKPHLTPITYEEWMMITHEPGILPFLQSIYATKEEMDQQYAYWCEHAAKAPALDFFPGVIDLLQDFINAGGKISIISLGQKPMIEKILAEKAPNLKVYYINAFSKDETMRKPAPGPALEAMRIMEVKPEECLMVDDLSPGLEMAKAVGIKQALATWMNPALEKIMIEKGDVIILRTVEEWRKHIFETPSSTC